LSGQHAATHDEKQSMGRAALTMPITPPRARGGLCVQLGLLGNELLILRRGLRQGLGNATLSSLEAGRDMPPWEIGSQRLVVGDEITLDKLRFDGVLCPPRSSELR
jgi:hypothetical protein